MLVSQQQQNNMRTVISMSWQLCQSTTNDRSYAE